MESMGYEWTCRYKCFNIIIAGYRRTTGGFDCKNYCDNRTYMYICPTYAFAPLENVSFIFEIVYACSLHLYEFWYLILNMCVPLGHMFFLSDLFLKELYEQWYMVCDYSDISCFYSPLEIMIAEYFSYFPSFRCKFT